jgi:hypothetical protein
VTLSNLVRWGGLAAVVAGALFIIADVVAVRFASGEETVQGLAFRAVVSESVGVLLALGLVSLYAYQSEATGYLGLLGFLAAFVGLWLGQQGIDWAALLANIGWILFGVAGLGARAYPRIANTLLIIGAVLSGGVNMFLAFVQVVWAQAPFVTGVGGVVDILFYAAIVWLGLSLFARRADEEVGRPAS